jgi:segregation and condensation protein A
MSTSQPQDPGALLPASWRVQLPIFEGPLDLLLHLVRINKVEITDIPVAVVCDQFHEYLRLMEELDLDIAAEFIYEAAVLIQVKSKLLLPQAGRPGEEAPEDPRHELVSRLLEYRRLKEAAQALAEVDRVRQGIWTRKPAPWKPEADPEETDVPLEEVSLFDLIGALRTVLERYDKEHPEPILLPHERFSVRSQIERLLALLEAGHPSGLFDQLRSLSCRAEAIAMFLAVLELARLNLVRIHQGGEGSDVLLFRTTRELQPEELEAISG